MNKKMLLIIILLSSYKIFADDIKLHDGRIITGFIQDVRADSIRFILNDGKLAQFVKEDIKWYQFDHADEILLNSMDVVACKIISENASTLICVTEEGIRKIPASTVMARTFSTGGKLRLDSIPDSTVKFKIRSLDSTKSKSTFLFAAVRFSSLQNHAEAWRREVRYPFSNQMNYAGLLLGYSLKNGLTPVLGYDMKVLQQKASGSFDRQFDFSYIYCGLEYVINFPLLPGLKCALSIHAGIFTVEGDVFSHSYRLVQVHEKQVAVRPAIAIQLPVMKKISVSIGSAFLYTNAITVKCPEPCDLQMQSLSIYAGLRFQLPEISFGRDKLKGDR